MPVCTIDGKKAEFKKGENLVEVAKRNGITIPVFCYHPGLSVVAQCRMCTVTVEGARKLQTACSTEATDGMVVHSNSDEAKQNRESVMEFLLINHPLDCPICDKSGECDLQDFSYTYGNAHMRYTEERRTYLDLDMGPVIKKNMNRCIHCTRCIRFGDEVAGIREMVALRRSNNTEISTLHGRPLETDYAGNYSDICPTGSLTVKDFRFRKRVWDLARTPTICEGCSRGCNMEIHHAQNVIHRCMPRENMDINRYWLCDEGRFNFTYVDAPDRVVIPQAKNKETDWASGIATAKRLTKDKKVALLVGSDLTQEEGALLQAFAKGMGAETSHFGTPEIHGPRNDGNADKILKRRSKTANLHGLEKLGIRGLKTIPRKTDIVVVVRGGRAVVPAEALEGFKVIGVGVFTKKEAAAMDLILPGVAFAEKSGTVFNFQGVEQKYKRAVLPPKGCKNLAEILALWTHQKKKGEAAEENVGGAA